MSDRRPAQPIRLFYASAHEDEDLCKKLEAHLTSLQHETSFIPLHERDIALGEDIEHTLDLYLETASLILLLIKAGQQRQFRERARTISVSNASTVLNKTSLAVPKQA